MEIADERNLVKHVVSCLSDHGSIVNAEPHVRGKELCIPLRAHHLHHLLKPEVAAHTTDYQNLGEESNFVSDPAMVAWLVDRSLVTFSV